MRPYKITEGVYMVGGPEKKPGPLPAGRWGTAGLRQEIRGRRTAGIGSPREPRDHGEEGRTA